MIENIREYTAIELRKIRAEKNVTLEDVAKSIGIDKNTLSRYEKGNTSIQLDYLEKILDYYKIPFHIFFANNYANKHISEQ